MRKIYLTLLLLFSLILFSAGKLSAQVNLTATAGPSLAATYPNLKGAFDAINAGTHLGNITIGISQNITENSTAILNSGAYLSVIIRPTVSGVNVTGNLNTAVVKFNGADNVTIDGFIAGGPTRDLNFLNQNTSTASAVIWVGSASASNGATNIIIRNCNITGNSVTTTYAGIMSSSGTSLGAQAEFANSNNTYQNNFITTSQSGIVLQGPAGNETGNIVRSNTIVNVIMRGVWIVNQQNVLISQNLISGINSVSTGLGSANSGIYVSGTISGGLVERNNINDIKKAGFWGCNGIQLNASSTTSNLTIANNFIFDIAAGGFNGSAIDDNGYGIAVNTGGGYNIYYNSIDLSTNQSAAASITASLWISNLITTASSLNIRNNIFSNQQTVGTRYAVYSLAANTVFAAINYNDYYSTGPVGFLGSSRANIVAWQAATGQDANSLSINPFFISTSDLHLANNSPLNGAATPISVTIDIDGVTRHATTPDIGADEFTPPPCNATLGGIASAAITSICASGNSSLSATGYSFGDGIAYQWEWSTNGTNWFAIPGATNPATANTGNISVTTQFRLTVTCTFVGGTGTSTAVTVTINNPTVTGTTPGSRCGTGTVTLGATGTGLNWYAASTGGNPIGSGSPFITPVISATTPYYVSASVFNSPITGGKPSTNGADGTNPVGGIFFTANEPFRLNSVVMYPTSAGTNTIVLYPGSTTTGTPIFTANVTFTGANASGVVVPLNWVIPVGNYTIYQVTSGAPCWRDFSAALPANDFPYNIGTACTLTDGSLSDFYYFFYNWNIAPICEGTRTSVTATIIPAPAITVLPSATVSVCSGTPVNLNVTSGNGGYVYSWEPGTLAGAGPHPVTPSASTTYTVTANDGTCVTTGTVAITVNPSPTPLSISPPSVTICSGDIQPLVTSGGTISGVTALTENFNGAGVPAGWQNINNSTGGAVAAAAWTLRPNNYSISSLIFSSNDATQFYMSNSDAQGSGTTTATILQSPAFSLTGFTSANLSFWHFFQPFPNSFARVEVSTNGTVWTTLQTYTTVQGGSSNFTNANINLNAYAGQPTVYVRFKYDATWGWFWAIDNVHITGTGPVNVTWTPVTGLFTNPAATIPYTAGQSYTTLYASPASSQTYTATATGPGGCSSVANATVNISGAIAVSVTLAASASPVCAGTPVTFTATTPNTGTLQNYKFYVNNILQQDSPGNVYTYIPVNGDNVKVELLINAAASCVSNNPATSNIINMVVNAVPNASISGSATVCTGSITTLTGSAPIGSGSVTSLQWYLDGTLIPGATTLTYGATLPGNYTLIAISNLGCPDTSAIFPVAHPVYTINATAGPNGTITPSGIVSVPCGNNQTFTITPNVGGYTILDVLVDGITNPGAIGSGTYTFNNVQNSSHTIHATFTLIGCASLPVADAGPDNSICAGSNHALAGSVSGSASPALSTWTTSGSGTFSPNAAFNTATTYVPSPADIVAGTVTLTLTTNDPDGASPCIASSSQMILTIRPVPALTITGPLGICATGTTTTTLTANTTGAISYQWYNGAAPMGTANTQLVSATGSYSVTAGFSNGCTKADTVSIVLFAAPTVSIGGNPVLCTRTANDLTAVATPGSGTIPAGNYQWKLTTVDIVGANNVIYSAPTAGSYTVLVTNSNGCNTLSAPFVLAADNSPLSGGYTIGAGPATCTNYESFAIAINDLNTRTISGNVRFDVVPGYTETVPMGGLALGTVALNASLAGRTLTFQKNGVGANPLLSAYGGGTAPPLSATPDGIFSIRGADNVTINGINLVDNNPAGNALMEYGYGLFKLSNNDGVQNTTIVNCVITLNRNNNGSSVLPMVEGSVGIMVTNSTAIAAITALTPGAASGTNSNNKFYTNTIVNTNHGIVLSGYTPPSPPALGDVGNDIGGNGSSTGNSILNFGGGGTGQSAGVRLLNQYDVNVSYNTINNNNGSGVNHTGVLRGIYGEVGLAASSTINNNNVTIHSGATTSAVAAIQSITGNNTVAGSNTVSINNNIVTGSYAAATTGTWTGILNSTNPATLNMNGNTVQNVNTPGTGAWIGISSASAATPVSNSININSNVLQNCNVTSTGAITSIANTVAAVSLSMNNNTITGNTKAASTPINWLATGAPVSATVDNNTIINNTVTGPSVAITVNCVLGAGSGAGSNYTFNGNTVSNNSITGITGTAVGTINGYSNISGPFSETLNNNIIRKLFITGTSTGLHVIRGLNNNTSGNAAHVRNVTGNSIDSLYTSSGMAAAITGIQSQVGYTINITKNRVHSLFPGQNGASAAFAKGIVIQSTAAGTTIAANNMVSLDLTQAFAPASNSVLVGNNALIGIDVAATTASNVNLFYNTIRLAGAGSGTGFGSSGINIANVTPTVDIRNNIITNLATPGGTAPGYTVGLRRPAAALTGYSINSNNNDWYTTQTATTPVYYDAVTAYPALAAFQAAVTTRETNSTDFIPAFVNTALNDLHLTPANCALNGGAQPIGAVSDDFDGDVRNATTPDIGADEIAGTGTPPGTWIGVNSDWMNTANWCNGIPTATTNVIIPNGASFYPDITTAAPVARNITIAALASVTIDASGTLTLKGNTANSGTITNNGNIVLSGTTAQTFPGAAGTIAAMNNLEINNAAGANIDRAFAVSGALLPTLGTITLNNNNITIASNATTGTARVGQVGTTNAFVYNGTGRFVVERYIKTGTGGGQHGKSWQLLATPTTGQTINAAWQEGNAPLGNAVPNHGTIITGMTPASGFDIVTPAGASMKTYNWLTTQWDNIPNTTSPIAEKRGYMVLVRGDRSVQTSAAPATPTTLRTTGQLYAPGANAPASTTVQPGMFESVGNPYASAINFTALTFSSMDNNKYYVWDPLLAGAYGLGGFQTILGPGWTPTPGGTTNYPTGVAVTTIQSGQAFIVANSTGSAGTLGFVESSKVAGNANVFRLTGAVSSLSTSLFAVNGSEDAIADGNMVLFDPAYAGSIDMDDARKVINSGENFGILSNGQKLAVEARKPVLLSDTIFYSFSNLKVQQYKLTFDPANIDAAGLEAFLVDRFNGTHTPVSLNSSTSVHIDITTDMASSAPDRFMIVFKNVVPLSYTDINAVKEYEDVKVSWNVSHETAIGHYEVERSADGINFSTIKLQPALNNGTGAYAILDEAPMMGINHYRIRSISLSGNSRYSEIVRVLFEAPERFITVHPNPIQYDKVLNVTISGLLKGIYNMTIINDAGKTLSRNAISYDGGKITYPVVLNSLVSHGVYMVTITAPDKKRTTFKIIY